jgi:hypothetical protein
MIITGEERLTREIPREPWQRTGDDDGPKSPAVKRPDPGDLMRRMQRVDPDTARRYRQRSGE